MSAASAFLPVRRSRWAVPLALALGLGFGALARLGDQTLPAPWHTLANTSALWGLAPFLIVRAVQLRGPRAATLGVAVMAAVVVVWVVLAPEPPTSRQLLLWGIVALAAGAVCGVAADLSSRGSSRLRIIGSAVMAGVIIGEAVYGILLIGGPQWWLELMIGLAVAVCLSRTLAERSLSVASAILVAAALFGAYLLYDAAMVA